MPMHVELSIVLDSLERFKDACNVALSKGHEPLSETRFYSQIAYI